MKNKKFVFAFIVLILGTLYSNAQSTLEQKLRADLEKSKRHRDAQLLKAQEQQRQRQDEKRNEMNINVVQQTTSNANLSPEMKRQANQNNTPALKRKPINGPARKEDINQ